MPAKSSPVIAVAFLLALISPAFAEDVCTLKGTLGGKPVSLTHCVVAFYEDQNSVTLWFTDTPVQPKEKEEFQASSNAPGKDASGKGRTTVSFAFCPGGGSSKIDPKAVKSIDMGVDVAGSPLLGRQWVFDLPKDNELAKVEKLSGVLKTGGKLSGRLRGGKTSDGLKYEWQADFDVALPLKSAFAGLSCGN